MSGPTKKDLQAAVDAVAQFGNASAAARELGLARKTLTDRVVIAERKGVVSKYAPKPSAAHVVHDAAIIEFIRSRPRTFEQIAAKFSLTPAEVAAKCAALAQQGYNVFASGATVSIEKRPVPNASGLIADRGLYTWDSDENGEYKFGVVSDNHLGSKYAREDVLHDLYDWFASQGITRVYNAGNWIDGEARFNKFDLKVHGMQAQIDYFCANYPRRPGITTYYVAGDDHEGWYCKDNGVDIGTLAEVTGREKFGRDDLRYLGYMESYIALTHRETRKTSQLMVVHPGGGSSYAISYAPQKFAEALQGGEKPAVIIFGHWHKMDVFNYRNVWLIQAGTTEDQTPFMRKQKLEAHVGGLIVSLKQDEKGGIMECTTTQRRYFDRGYHNGSFSMSGPISHPPIKRKVA